MHVPPCVWLLTLALTAAVLLVDLVLVARRPRVPTTTQLARHLGAYVGLAVAFGLGVLVTSGPHFAAQFYAGWLTEYSLSVDNLFIFLLIMAQLKVPERLQQTALMVGIVIALVLRGAFIAVGAAAIASFGWVFYLFGGFLVLTAVRLAREGTVGSAVGSAGGGEDRVSGAEPDGYQQNAGMRLLQRRLHVARNFSGRRLVVREGGRRVVTPLLVVILALGTTDLLFALDSIPAIYGLTREPYLVLTANIFALMGLRQLYFLIGGLLGRLVYLGFGLAVLLALIGVELVLHALHVNTLPFVNGGRPVGWAPEVPIWVSLLAIVGILAVTTLASLVRTGRERAQEPQQEPASRPASGQRV